MSAEGPTPGAPSSEGSSDSAPVALIILDGWGLAPPGPGNAVDLADTPVFDQLYANNPHATLVASGLDVGLPEGQIGNSEVGHLNLGAGRVVYQDLTRIDRAISDGTFDDQPALVAAVKKSTEGSGVLHIVGLASFGGVHSHLNHIVEIARMAARGGVREVRVHAITDGRDVAPDAAQNDLTWLEGRLADIEATTDGSRAKVVSVIGRYWAMDRDHRWDRTKRAFDLFIDREGRSAPSAHDAARLSREAGVTDEFIEPWVIAGDGGLTGDGIRPGDVVVYANFRPDRMRQLVPAISSSAFTGFDRGNGYRPATRAVCMCEYASDLGLPVAFPPNELTDTLADVLAEDGLGQLHVAETEKYAHVTYFFNGGVEAIHAGEVRLLADSPRDVATYDLKPQMAAHQVASNFVAGIADPNVRFAVINFANPDMVGHTGVIPAAILACETVDTELARVVAAVHARGGTCLITADHGNAEHMLTADGKPHTAHTTNLVPIIVAAAPGTEHATSITSMQPGRLADIAPTVLALLGIQQPSAMTGVSLIQV